MRELYDRGLAGTGALAAKLTREYYEYSRGEWLRLTLTRLLEYELELKSQRALLGTADAQTKDALAAAEVGRTFDDGAQALSERFVCEVLLGTIVPSVQREVDQVDGITVAVHEVDSVLENMKASIEKHVADGVRSASTFYAEELAKLLGAPIKACFDDHYDEEGDGDSDNNDADDDDDNKGASSGFMGASGMWDLAPSSLAKRFWTRGDAFVKSLFGTSAESLPAHRIEMHKQVVIEPIIQLGQYPEFVEAVTGVVRAQCVRACEKVRVAAASVVAQLTADVSLYLSVVPDRSCQNASIHFETPKNSKAPFLDALKMAFLRYLPTPAALQGALGASEALKLSTYEELSIAQENRRTLDEKVLRVGDAARELIVLRSTSTRRTLWTASGCAAC
eukprot:7390934-Prymnesium_polylepis.1